MWHYRVCQLSADMYVAGVSERWWQTQKEVIKLKERRKKTLLPRRLFPFSYYSHSSFATSAWHSDFLILFVCNLPFDWKRCCTASQQKRSSCWRMKYENWDACDVGVGNVCKESRREKWLGHLTDSDMFIVFVCAHSDRFEWWFVSFVYTIRIEFTFFGWQAFLVERRHPMQTGKW